MNRNQQKSVDISRNQLDPPHLFTDLVSLPVVFFFRSQIDREDSDRLRSEVDDLVKQLVDQLTGLENHLRRGRRWGR